MDLHMVAEQTHLNVSPEGFHLWAGEFYKCRQSFKGAEPYSPVPYYLLCHAIELKFKAIHLEQVGQAVVKNLYGHNLKTSYAALPGGYKKNLSLSAKQVLVLEQASDIYDCPVKGFEYFNVGHATRGYSDFPDLDALDELANTIFAK